MTEKSGNRRQRLASCFDKTPASGTSTCPFKGPDIAIVPVRYALDRSRHDSNPNVLKPLPAQGRWATLPELHSRRYTLRQLQDGYLYVFDETAKTLHEYRYGAQDAGLTRIVWNNSHLGQDRREPASGSSSPAKPYLLYPRKHVLHIAYAPMQWTWRICEHLRSHDGSRAQWMKRLDLAAYSRSMNEPGTLPLSELAVAVADIDAGQVTEDARFADTSVPTQAPPEAPTQGQKPNWVAVGADVHWLGSVPDRDSALLIALDDPLAILQDLGLQLAADQAAYHLWQEEHEHRIQIANIVAQLCGLPGEPKEKLPESVRGDPGRTQEYLLAAEAYLEQWKRDHGDIAPHPPSEDVTQGLYESTRLLYAMRDNFRSQPADSDFLEWRERERWRREVDLPGARRYLQRQYAKKKTLLDRVKQTQADFKRCSNHISLDPLKLFIDTGNPRTLLYLKELMLHLAEIFVQDEDATLWMLKQEQNATTLFGTLRYGFSAELKEALHQEAGKLIVGFSDIANIASRAGELNSLLNHPEFANSPWMNTLKQPARDTFAALQTLARSGTAAMASLTEKLLMVFAPVDARLAAGEHQNLPALLRNLLMGQVLTNTPHSLQIDQDIPRKLHEWTLERARLHQQLQSLQRRWFITEPRNRKGLTHELETLIQKAQVHDIKIPMLLDYQNGKHASAIQSMMSAFMAKGRTTAIDWATYSQQWMQSRSLSAGIGYSAVLINLINTAIVWETGIRDGELTSSEAIKVGYNLGYTASLFMALFVSAPWSAIKQTPIINVSGTPLSLLERSADFWKARGHTALGHAVDAFRARILATGALAMGAALLEIVDIVSDLQKATNPSEKTLHLIKIASVAGMGLSGLLQIGASTLTFQRYLPRLVMSLWFSVTNLAVGLVYLAASLALNLLKRDQVGVWLSKCCWSKYAGDRYEDTVAGQALELRDFTEIQLSPHVLIKRTTNEKHKIEGGRQVITAEQDGAWIQVRLPHELRGKYFRVGIDIDKELRNLFPKAPNSLLKESFLVNGEYKRNDRWQKINGNKPAHLRPPALWPALGENEDVIWQTWIPLGEKVETLELQIWYPPTLLTPKDLDSGYRFQFEIGLFSQDSNDGLKESVSFITYENRDSAQPILIIP